MKRILMLILAIAFLLAGCAKTDAQTATLPQSTINTETVKTEIISEIEEEEFVRPILSVSVPAACEKYTLTNGDEIYSYTAPPSPLLYTKFSKKKILYFHIAAFAA